jgi:hypothetical protein
MKLLFLATLFAIVLSACTDSSVPRVKDPNNVVVNGEPMTQRDFIEKYCIGKPNNETCLKVQHAASIASLRSKNGVPRF